MSATATSYEIHPLAHLLPEMREAEYAELREDIAANGLHEAITLYEGKILDGRHRYRVCTELGLWPTFTAYEGDAPAAYVLSLNVKRRQLSQSQKAMLATDFLPHLEAENRANLREVGRAAVARREARPVQRSESEDSNHSEGLGRSAARAAEQVGVGHASVVRANKVKKEDPELAERVRNGEVTVTAAHKQVTERERIAARKNAPASLDTQRGRQQAEAHGRRFTDFASSLAGYADGVQNLDIALIRAAMDPAELDQWISSLGKSLTKLRRFRTDLQEGRN